MPSTPVTQALEALGEPHRLHAPRLCARSSSGWKMGSSSSFCPPARPESPGPGSGATSACPALPPRPRAGYSKASAANRAPLHPAHCPANADPGDRSLLAYDTVSVGASVRDAGVVLAHQDLERTLPLEFGDFTDG